MTREQATTAGSRMLAGYRSPFDATVVARLAEAGTVTLGKLNCDEFAMGSSTENSAFHVTRNPWDESRVADSDEEVVIKQNWTEIRRFMWNYVGIVRTTKRLERALNRVALLRQETEDYYGHFRVTPDLVELRNLVVVAELIVRSALARKESRGLHYTLDYPDLLPEPVDTILVPA